MILKRLRNLWKLSTIEIPKDKKDPLKALKDLIQPKAKVVQMENPIEKLEI